MAAYWLEYKMTTMMSLLSLSHIINWHPLPVGLFMALEP